MAFSTLPRPLVVFGLAGLLPQAGCLALMLVWPDARWFTMAAACFYAAIILSFLGGMWWMAGLMAGRKEPAAYLLAVVASLSGWAGLLPWALGWSWPAPSLGVLGLLLLASPLVDGFLARDIALPPAWLRLRVAMASGLGLLTLAVAALA
ncbi:DUF3429 domain-containing protein [Novosphingobium sp. TH158]|uniref:DUF3429 domain-containing protein n=1 Tax=Novosphingobium sp. TH158 TaxID=2067455 RepID=UPI000C79D4BD|nr:DUF3429 domain-containing protein [Novosphingobium sp. TH158]PLK25726.1 DUF3429 domain-containing protein [Novosphingobium sp. TH158]